MNRLVIILIIFCSFTWLAPVNVSSDSERIWKSGKEAKNNGNFEQALNIWETAKQDESIAPDPRIAFDYIELVSQQDMKTYFDKASAMYYWGISEGCNDKYLESYRNELSRIKPLLTDDEFKEFHKKLKNDTAGYCTALTGFWRKIDPTVNTDYNERLIEHWKRIAYSKENFNKNSSSFFGTDDRADIYIRLGKPDRISKGTLQFRPGLVRAWIQDIVDFQNQTGNTRESSNISNNSTASSQTSSQTEAPIGQGLAEFIQVDELAKDVLLLHRYPSYEIWVYRKFNDNKFENLIYIFGQDGDTGSFGLRKSLDEMIPSRAFSNISGNRGYLKPGILLQLLFYEQTTQVDHYFEDAFRDIESKMFTRNGFNRNTSSQIESQNQSILRSKMYNAPSQSSDFERTIPSIEMEVYQYRLLSENNEPVLASYLVSSPQKAMYLDQSMERDLRANNYRFKNNVVLFGKDYNIIQKETKRTGIEALRGRGSINDLKESISYFPVKNSPAGESQVFTVELLNLTKDSTAITDDLSKDHLRGFGRKDLAQPKPLNTNPDNLEMSDIILGHAANNEKISNEGPARFHIAHDRKIAQNRNLAIHFEVYHLSSNGEGSNAFEVEYQVEKKSGNFLKKLFGGSDEISLTLTFETLQSYYKSDLEIETSSFDPGTYELSLTATDPVSGQEVNRTVEFEIVDPEADEGED